MQEIVSGIHTFSGLGIGRVYLLKGADGYTILDGGIPPAGKKIMAQLAAAGISAESIKRILITHAHPDHVGGIPHLIKETGADLVVPIGEAAVVNGEMDVPRAPTRFRPPKTTYTDMQASSTLNDGDTLDILGGLQAIETPGHAPGHMSYWQPERRILFTGDTIFRMPGSKLRLPWAFLTVDMAQNIRSIKRLAALEPETVLFGHGEPLIRDAAKTLHDFAQRLS